MAELSDIQLSASEAKKEKKKRKRELRERALGAEAPSSSPWSPDHSFAFSGRDNELGEACKKKESEQRELSDSQLDAAYVSMESEVTSDAGTGILTHKKKKKRKKKRELREGALGAEAPSSSPWSPDCSFVCQTNGNEQREASDSQLAASCVSMESEVIGDAGTGILTHKKKKRKKKREFREGALGAEAPSSSPWSPDCSFVCQTNGNEQREASDSQLAASCVSMESEVIGDAGTGILTHKKKKRKKKRELREGALGAEAPSSSPWSPDCSFVCQTNENEQREASDSQLAASCVSMESEVIGDAGAGILTHKKKKKKRVPIEPDDAELRVCVAQEKTSASPRTDIQENVDVWHKGKKKKREKAQLTEGAEANSPNPSRQGQIEAGGPEDTQTELFTSSPLSPCPSLLFQGKRKGGSKRDTSGELGSARTEKKSRRKRKGSRTEESDTTDGLAVEEGGGLANPATQQPGSSREQGPLEGSNGSAYSPTPVHDVEKELSPPGHRPSQAQSVFESLDSSKVCKLDLEMAIQELEPFIPHARSLSATSINQLAQRDLIRFKNFQQEGVAVKFGRFSQKENEQLIANVQAFLEDKGITNAEKLFFPDRFPEEKEAIRNLKVKNLFGVQIAEGIPRPWRLVYYHARKIFDPRNSHRVYSRKEIKKLKKYHAVYGSNWKKISELMNRSSHSVALKYSQIKSKPNSGRWSKEEVKQLIRAVEKTISSKVRGLDSALEEGDAEKALSLVRENLYKGISWKEVEAQVGTRHWRQCKHKWMSIVTRRMSRGKSALRGLRSVQAKVNLIERMYELNVEDASEIDWEELSSALGNVPPEYVQRRFCKMKVQHVPAWNSKRFPEIIDHLYEVTLPGFKNRLLKRKERRPKTPKPSKTGQKRTYKFSDIFWFSDDDLSEEEDDENERSEPASDEVDSGNRKDSGSL